MGRLAMAQTDPRSDSNLVAVGSILAKQLLAVSQYVQAWFNRCFAFL